MKKLINLIWVAALAVATVAPAMAQGAPASGKMKTTQVKAKAGSSKKTMAKVANQVSGSVKGDAKGTTFVVGTKEGTYTVDASKARCTYNGKFYSVKSLKGGNLVTVIGPATGKTIKATQVKVNYAKGATKSTKTLSAGTARTKMKPSKASMTGGH